MINPTSTTDPSLSSLLFGSDCDLRGTLHITDNLLLLGAFDGALKVDGHLEVGPGGSLRGTATVGSLRVRGVVDATVNATGAVELCAGGELRGGVSTPCLQIARDDAGVHSVAHDEARSAVCPDARSADRDAARPGAAAVRGSVAEPGPERVEGIRPEPNYAGVLHRRSRRRAGAAMSPTSTG